MVKQRQILLRQVGRFESRDKASNVLCLHSTSHNCHYRWPKSLCQDILPVDQTRTGHFARPQQRHQSVVSQWSNQTTFISLFISYLLAAPGADSAMNMVICSPRGLTSDGIKPVYYLFITATSNPFGHTSTITIIATANTPN